MKGKYITFERFIILTIVSVYLLILAGGIVRTTGSGMGCPDWPKCFGQWVPPTEVSQLPFNYKELYSVPGYETVFNAQKTWIEYINRLLGALIGVFILVSFILSFKFLKDKPIVVFLTGLSLVLTLLQGIVGKIVVSTNLKPLIISFHFWGSMVIIGLLIYIMCFVNKDRLIIKQVSSLRKSVNVILVVLALTIIQIILGSQVRQQVDSVASSLGFDRRSEWIEQLTGLLNIHGISSYFVLASILYFSFLFYNATNSILPKLIIFGLIGFVGLEMIAGVSMANFNIPAFIQPIHMLFSTLILGLELFALFVLKLNINRSIELSLKDN